MILNTVCGMEYFVFYQRGIVGNTQLITLRLLSIDEWRVFGESSDVGYR
jgi:hypothetical protein